MEGFLKTLKKGIMLSFVLIVLCGFIYPLALTGVSQLVFKNKANGSLIEVNGKTIGSKIIGQNFTDKRFFKSRPSAVNYNTYTKQDKVPNKEGNTAYKGVASGSQNLAPSNPELTERIKKDLDKFLKENPEVNASDIPEDLLTASGSGLDPNISPKSASVQIPAISKATGITEKKLQQIVDKNIEVKFLGVFGEDRVNVLMTNIDVAKELGLL